MELQLQAQLEMDINHAFNLEMLPIQVVQDMKRMYDVPAFYIQEAVADYLNQMKTYEHCEKVGHSFVDESYGGPEAGAISASCTKCGYSFHHQLY